MPYGIRPWTTKPMFKVSRWLFWTFINDMPWCNINHGVNTAYIHNYTANYYAVIKDCNWDPSWHIQQWIHPSSSFVNLGCPTEHEIGGLDENERRVLEKKDYSCNSMNQWSTNKSLLWATCSQCPTLCPIFGSFTFNLVIFWHNIWDYFRFTLWEPWKWPRRTHFEDFLLDSSIPYKLALFKYFYLDRYIM